MNTKKIGNFIANLRKEKNLTQKELADKLNIKDKAVSRWETGKNMPDISILEMLAKELGVTINELLLGEKIDEQDFKEKSEYNTINTLNYTKEKLKQKNKNIFLILILAIFITFILASLYLTSKPFSDFNSFTETINDSYKTAMKDENINKYANILKIYYSDEQDINYYNLAIILLEKQGKELNHFFLALRTEEDNIRFSKMLEEEFNTYKNKQIDYYELAKNTIEERHDSYIDNYKEEIFSKLAEDLTILSLLIFVIISIIFSLYFIFFTNFDNIKQYSKVCLKYLLLLITLFIIYLVLTESFCTIIENKISYYPHILDYNSLIYISNLNFLITLVINLLFNIKNMIKFGNTHS